MKLKEALIRAQSSGKPCAITGSGDNYKVEELPPNSQFITVGGMMPLAVTHEAEELITKMKWEFIFERITRVPGKAIKKRRRS